MTRFDKTCIVVAFLSIPLLWLSTPPPQLEQIDLEENRTESWPELIIQEKQELTEFRNRLVSSAALGFVPKTGDDDEVTATSTVPSLFYGTFQLGERITALVENGDIVQLCGQGDTLTDGSICLSVSVNTVNILLPDGTEKKLSLYEEAL